MVKSKTMVPWMLLRSMQPRSSQNEVGLLISAAYVVCNILLKQSARSCFIVAYVIYVWISLNFA